MSTTTERPFALGLRGQTWRGTAPDLQTAIQRAEKETGGIVWAGWSEDGGIPRFDADADLEDYMRTHRSRGAVQSKPLPDEYAAQADA